MLHHLPWGDIVYGCSHIAKVYALEMGAVVDARKALIDLQAGKTPTNEFIGKSEEQIRSEIRTMLGASANSIKKVCLAEMEPEPEETMTSAEFLPLQAQPASNDIEIAATTTTVRRSSCRVYSYIVCR